MTLTRRKKREEVSARQLANKLFFEFVGEFQKFHEVVNGVVYVQPVVWHDLQRLDNKWRYFCNQALNNPKRIVKFKIDYLVKLANDHVDRIRMNELNKYINLYMHTIEIPDAGFLKQFPSEMEELTRRQFITYAGELSKLFAGQQNIDDFKTNLVFKFLDIKHHSKKYEKLSEVSKIEISENIFRVAELLDYFFIPEDEKVRVNLSWTKNFIRRIGLILSGPAAALTDITFQEYKDANTYYREYLSTSQEDALNHLVAVLYRPRFLFWKMRYRPGKFFEWRSRQMKRISFAKRFGVYLFFSACEEFLRTGTFQADGKDINLKILYETTVKEKRLQDKIKYKEDTGLTGLAYSLAKTGIYGDVKKVFSQNLYDVLVLLFQQRIEYLNQLENMEIK